MQLASVPDGQPRLIVVGCSIRKPLPILQAFLASLLWQERPANVVFRFVFVADFPTANTDAEQFLRAWVKEQDGEILRGIPAPANDFADGPGLASHQWSPSAMARVGQNKNKILKRALELKAEAVWLVDADLILDRTVFASLWAAERPIACAVFWTHWNKQSKETVTSFSGPQVWLRHPYLLDGRGMEEADFRRKLVKRELLRVWGQGACSLIRTPVIAAGIDFSHIPNEPALMQGLMAGEDRHFCIKAERSHIDMWADAWPDIFHIYHTPEDVEQIPAMLERMGTVHPDRAMLGDLVSLRLEAIEPFPQPNGQWHRPSPGFLRGRLGQLALLPEIEEAVLNLPRGQQTTIPVHFPLYWPLPYLRGRRRLIRLTLIDCKPFGYPPNLENELLRMGAGSMDRALLTPQQREAVPA